LLSCKVPLIVVGTAPFVGITAFGDAIGRMTLWGLARRRSTVLNATHQCHLSLTCCKTLLTDS